MKIEFGLGRSLWRGVSTAAVLAVPLVGCGGGASVASEPARHPSEPARQVASVESATRATVTTSLEAPPPAAAAAPATPERVLPTACVAGTVPCAAPGAFVEQVCRSKYPDVALAMFSKGTPWRRGYLKVEKLEPVNMYDGERSEQWLTFGEEVLVLRTRGPSGHSAVQVSGPTDLDILRWDGTCATVRQEMLAQYPTNTSIATARVVWKYLDTPIQEALLTSPLVAHASERERPACKGSTMKHPDDACDKASRKLTDAITVALRGGLALPAPVKLPAWRE